METSGEKQKLKDFNTSNLPPAGSEWVGKFFNGLWETARKDKIERLGLHQRFLSLHNQFRGKRRRQTYPRVGINHIFKTVETYCATLTEKVPMAELTADNADDPAMVQAFNQDIQLWWVNTNQQFKLRASTQNMQVYGTAVEKFTWDIQKDDFSIILRDIFNIFPAPGYKLCYLDIPYICDVDFLEEHEIRSIFGVPKEITIPADADDQIAGTTRETTRGGNTNDYATDNYASNYASVAGKDDSLRNKTMVVEIWCQDRSIAREPITEQVPVTDDFGRPFINPDGTPMVEERDTGEVNEYPVYPDGIRKVVICPALLGNDKIKGVLDDSPNPSINWTLIDIRIQQLVETGIPSLQPVLDQNGFPVADPRTGQPAMQQVMKPVEPIEARKMIMERAKISFPLWGCYPYSATPSRIDTTQWFGFSVIEQLEELVGKAELMLTKYFLALEWRLFPILINPQGSGVEISEVDNRPGLQVRPTVATAAGFRYIEPPSPPSEYLQAIQFTLGAADEIAMTPAVTQGQRPQGVSAAAAIIALQDKASTLTGPQIQQIDDLIEKRGNAYIHFKMNFDYKPRQIIVDQKPVMFRGIDVFTKFKYKVESGSSAPITKAGRRQMYVELFQMRAMDLESLLTFLEIPRAKLIVERIMEQNSVPGALQILAQAGVPPEVLAQLYQMAMQPQNIVQNVGGTTMKTAEDKAGGYSEGLNAAKQGMAELSEG
jgi:hypothetical protein